MVKNTFVIIMLLMFSAVFASDIEREKRLAAEIEDSILDGDVLYLKSDDLEFFNIYTEAETDGIKGAVIILHGRGYHPDWEDVVKPLRVGLAARGWNTLSMQMPVLGKKAKYYDYVPILHEAFPRIEAGIRYLEEQGIKNIVLIAHSCSVHMAMSWFEKSGFKKLNAYIGIGMGATDYKQPMEKPLPLDQISIPVMDVYGGDEYPAVIKGAGDRLKMMNQSGHKKSLQISVPGADHYFHDKGEELTSVISEWLDTLR